ncbi:hypothetical protein FD754_017499 [Muntiacus muntjak]|uniref:Uncharacterized protein n=1 Tax=Muntiacus muntjak TaxID=9888 RepID=A0A5N3VU14_MUNMU|nr:hypothetical protein FD754_017499 [Muntiacus muntjak]
MIFIQTCFPLAVFLDSVMARRRRTSLSWGKENTNEWNKNDDRLLQAVENGDAEKVASLLGKKGASATKHDSEGKTA